MAQNMQNGHPSFLDEENIDPVLRGDDDDEENDSGDEEASAAPGSAATTTTTTATATPANPFSVPLLPPLPAPQPAAAAVAPAAAPPAFRRPARAHTRARPRSLAAATHPWDIPTAMPANLQALLLAQPLPPPHTTNWLVGERTAMQSQRKRGRPSRQYNFFLKRTKQQLNAVFLCCTRKGSNTSAGRGEQDRKGVIVVSGASLSAPVIIGRAPKPNGGAALWEYLPWNGLDAAGADIWGLDAEKVVKTFDNSI
ncbi:uncharacterized protein AB675_5179 [Cyphellophora attinorum]|uniref:Uncharacterized protein n=1 Tax=Cyphellophora attinorum TaxID=1664694 RepID=A0A0N1H8G3_9EURO|nr:uncharacterized protein AB675_5179 [Phialophora attinorum]KPI39405.1 hypothetical protein AB675_5179 [Phialophora attinorum]